MREYKVDSAGQLYNPIGSWGGVWLARPGNPWVSKIEVAGGSYSTASLTCLYDENSYANSKGEVYNTGERNLLLKFTEAGSTYYDKYFTGIRWTFNRKVRLLAMLTSAYAWNNRLTSCALQYSETLSSSFINIPLTNTYTATDDLKNQEHKKWYVSNEYSEDPIGMRYEMINMLGEGTQCGIATFHLWFSLV